MDGSGEELPPVSRVAPWIPKFKRCPPIGTALLEWLFLAMKDGFRRRFLDYGWLHLLRCPRLRQLQLRQDSLAGNSDRIVDAGIDPFGVRFTVDAPLGSTGCFLSLHVEKAIASFNQERDGHLLYDVFLRRAYPST